MTSKTCGWRGPWSSYLIWELSPMYHLLWKKSETGLIENSQKEERKDSMFRKISCSPQDICRPCRWLSLCYWEGIKVWLQLFSVPLASLFYFKGHAMRYRKIVSSCLGYSSVEWSLPCSGPQVLSALIRGAKKSDQPAASCMWSRREAIVLSSFLWESAL